MNDQDPGRALLQQSEILFLDFLGFAEAVQHWSDDRMESLIEVLAAIAAAQSAFNIEGKPQSDGSYKITSRAEITTFSHHIVVSYPHIARPSGIADDPWAAIADGWTGMVRQQMQKITAQVVMAALGVGLLVRGGLSRGKLYHRANVVVGEAMVDAHRIEREVARTSRIALSPRIDDDNGTYTDTDGQRCLDYLTDLMLLVEDRHGDVRAWAEPVLKHASATIKSLADAGRQKDAEKWNILPRNFATQSRHGPDHIGRAKVRLGMEVGNNLHLSHTYA
jgi:hypothetical protein